MSLGEKPSLRASSMALRMDRRIFIPALLCTLVVTLSLGLGGSSFYSTSEKFAARFQRVPMEANHILRRCTALRASPGPGDNFYRRDVSDRFEEGTVSTLIRNATIWTGNANGTDIVYGDLLLDRGLIQGIGEIPQSSISGIVNLAVVDANGAWVTPGLVDLHSHLGVYSAPYLNGADDLNSRQGPILPWLRSIDAFNTHDDAFRLSISGGVTSAQILPGSGNAIGGQAFMVKLRKTSERSPTSMMIEPPYTLNGTTADPSLPLRWRHMKQACGENLRGYGNRMDSIWALRSAYNEARKVRDAQDAYCQKAERGLWESLEGGFPENLQWEMLVDVLRGRVKITNHCYEAVDFDDIVRISNEFQFPIASFHHATEAWLIPEALKRTWGGTPTIAMFAVSSRYKREAFRATEFAPRILADNGIPVVMKSDHPVLNSRYLLFEAQQAHYYGLPPHLALSSVTSVPAAAAGLDHRIGILRGGGDADVILWDSHPLRLGATPVQVWIDGITQLEIPSESGYAAVSEGKNGSAWREVPEVPNWDIERELAIHSEGLPPLDGHLETGKVVFQNVKEVWTRGADGKIEEFYANSDLDDVVGTVVVERGKIVCGGLTAACLPASTFDADIVVDLHNGSISPGFMSFGSPLGLEEIAAESSTGNGFTHDSFKSDAPSILGDPGSVTTAMDALKFQTRNALVAYRSGVTLATSFPVFTGESRIISGLSTTFRTGARHALDRGALIQRVAALHVLIGRSDRSGSVSLSEQIAGLRRLLFGWESKDTETGQWFNKASEGVIPLVIEVGSADVMSTLIILKQEVEERKGTHMRMVFSGAAEAHMIAPEIAKAGVGVILNPARPFPLIWDDRRILPGPPLSDDTALTILLRNGVVVGLGVPEADLARNARFDMAWAALESQGRIDRREAYALVSTNLEKLLGIWGIGDDPDLVAYDGGSAFELSGKPAAVLSPQRGVTDLL